MSEPLQGAKDTAKVGADQHSTRAYEAPTLAATSLPEPLPSLAPTTGLPERIGRYRIELTLPSYALHGTNVPWGVGMEVSHGCVRLYPEDIERRDARRPAVPA